MNDLIQLDSDLKNRYKFLVQGRRSLRHLAAVVHELVKMLKIDAKYMIKPPTKYWAVLSNAVAGAVEEAQVLLAEGANVAAVPIAGRLLFFLCHGMGYESDINEARLLLSTIKDIVELSHHQIAAYELVGPLQRVNTLKYQTYANRMQHMLSNIEEESQIQATV